MSGAHDIGNANMAYLLLLLMFPVLVIFLYRIRMFGALLTGIARMVAQLLLVGFYLHYIFVWNNLFLTLAWILVMAVVADFSVLSGCGLELRRFVWPLLAAMLLGTLVPLYVFVMLVIDAPTLFEASFSIPVSGMILGNCMRANIVGIKGFYDGVRKDENRYMLTLAQGASRSEALAPYIGESLSMALQPTLATMATIGLVSLPGMMTGLLLGGADPMVSIKYQIGIMVAIFSGTALTVWACLMFTLNGSFRADGMLDKRIFKERAATKPGGVKGVVK